MSNKATREKRPYDGRGSRHLGVNFLGRPKSPINKRPHGPGQHGQRRKKPSDFGLQLMAKQRLRWHYGNIGEKRFRRYYDEAMRRKGDTSENLIELLERRLDAALVRMKFAPTPFTARQLINHKHVLVNGQIVNIASYSVSDGDEIELSEKARNIPAVIQAIESQDREIPEYVEANPTTCKGKFLRGPKLEDVPYPCQMEPNLVIEFYSR